MRDDNLTLDAFEKIRDWLLRTRPETESELSALRKPADPLSRDELRLRVAAGYLGIDLCAAASRRKLLSMVQSLEAEMAAESCLPYKAPASSVVAGAVKRAQTTNETVQGEGLEPVKKKRLLLLWNWAEEQREPSASRPARGDRIREPDLPFSEAFAPMRQLCSLRTAAPFLRDLAPFRQLQAIGHDVAIPDAPRQQAVSRLGWASPPKEKAAKNQAEAAFDAMARIASLSGEPLRVVSRLLGLLSGAKDMGLPEAPRIALCVRTPKCGQCPAQSACLYASLHPANAEGQADVAPASIGSIKTWNEQDRPRERLALQGPETLGEAELLAILLRTGHGKKSALDLAREILVEAKSLVRLDQMSLTELQKVDGIGPAKAVEIKAALELGKRMGAAGSQPGERFTGSRKVFESLRGQLANLEQEKFFALLLNNKNEIIKQHRVSEGTLTQSLVHPREAFREAIRMAAASVIFLHNHPSGDPTPSEEDARITARLKSAGDMLGIRVLDHIVVGRNGYYSFADEGRL